MKDLNIDNTLNQQHNKFDRSSKLIGLTNVLIIIILIIIINPKRCKNWGTIIAFNEHRIAHITHIVEYTAVAEPVQAALCLKNYFSFKEYLTFSVSFKVFSFLFWVQNWCHSEISGCFGTFSESEP